MCNLLANNVVYKWAGIVPTPLENLWVPGNRNKGTWVSSKMSIRKHAVKGWKKISKLWKVRRGMVRFTSYLYFSFLSMKISILSCLLQPAITTPGDHIIVVSILKTSWICTPYYQLGSNPLNSMVEDASYLEDMNQQISCFSTSPGKDNHCSYTEKKCK